MSRIKRFASALLSGYALILANILYTLASIPLALHYLSKEEFGLWALVMQVCNFNQILIDLGMSSAVTRVLIDHKDDRESHAYGSVIQTGFLILVTQGLFLALGGALISFWLPQWMEVPVEHWRVFRLLVTWQCVMLGISMAMRICAFILQAHQRFDIGNYAQLSGFLVGLAVLWGGFAAGLGLFSLLASAIASMLCSGLFCLWRTIQLGFFPERGKWGRFNRTIFKELFFYGTDLFLVMVGLQLITASQMPVITRTLGLETAAIWAVATKLFMLSQQLVYRLFDYSTAPFSEMMVRGEKARLQSRFRDVIVVTGSASVAAGFVMAVCNGSFLALWTHHRIFWENGNNFLMAGSLIVYASTRCHNALASVTKRVGGMKYVYFAEGLAFVCLGLFVAPRFGLAGVIGVGIITNLLFGGWYGLNRSAKYFETSIREIIFSWLRPSLLVFGLMLPAALGIWYLTRSLAPLPQLILGGGSMILLAGFILWQFGLPPHLRGEIGSKLGQARNRWLARV